MVLHDRSLALGLVAQRELARRKGEVIGNCVELLDHVRDHMIGAN